MTPIHKVALIFITFQMMAARETLASTQRIDHFYCDGHPFALSTTDKDVYTLSQSLAVRLPGGRSRPIELREPTFVLQREFRGMRVLAAFVDAYLCRMTRHGPVLELYYVCPQYYADDIPEKDCSETGEWVRYIWLTGGLLDAGFGPDDPRYLKLDRWLGFPDVYQERPHYVDEPPSTPTARPATRQHSRPLLSASP